MESDELMALTLPPVCDHAAHEYFVANTQCRTVGDLGFHMNPSRHDVFLHQGLVGQRQQVVRVDMRLIERVYVADFVAVSLVFLPAQLQCAWRKHLAHTHIVPSDFRRRWLVIWTKGVLVIWLFLP